ncbi:nitrogen fixation protein NifU [Desulfurella multipotens]|uniref:Nitrogen fixation protein NifU n=1 Tax=Desulfurella multipotens TaxID=79269 RepID=A0A1G6P585_9BACT|nr:iron-sulfur cluster assembly scaffold protein [Desulfurella multipotens]SDC74575.1 nitrogen fixation protein NifU [Desulfurella multipotens]
MESFESHFFYPIKDTVLDPDGIGVRENIEFNAKIIFYVKTKQGIIVAIDYKVKACPVAIAVASFLAKTFKNKTIENALSIDENFLNSNLVGIPKERLECANSAIEAFKEALINSKGGK